MSYISCRDIAKYIGLAKDDRVFVSSDVSRLAFVCSMHDEMFDADLFISSIMDVIGENGTLVFPAYNWGFCKGEAFDYRSTPSKVGSLTNAALKRKDFRRTRHPIYSFAVWGKDTGVLCSLDNKSSFGADSPFAHFYENGYKNLFIDVDYKHSATFVHYCEEKLGVPYRFIKDFTADYIDEHGTCEERIYSMYVRPLDIEVDVTINPMHEVFAENQAVQEYTVNDILFRLLDMRKAYDLVELDITSNASGRIASYLGQESRLAGQQMYVLAQRLFPVCRSITGDGVRETLRILQEIIPTMSIHEVPAGTKAFDWTVPKEWVIREAWIKDSDGNKVIDFKDSNLHVLGYAAPIDKKVSLEELKAYVYTLPQQPEWIPYVTSYYKERSGFCMSHRQMDELEKQDGGAGSYHIHIDSELKDGSLTYGEIIISGKTKEEIFLSTYICHPSMANNELSGPCAAIYLAKWIEKLADRRYTYRIVFVPETIGSITYLSRNLKEMQENIIAGFVLTCVGDDRAYSYMPSRYGNTLADKAAKNTLKYAAPDYLSYPFLKRGSDERQYCSPGIDLPVCSIMRSKYGEYPEYHTSADNMTLISPEGLQGAFEVYKQCITVLENNETYKVNCLCEPQLGKRGLYPTESYKGSADHVKAMMDLIAYADGKNDLIDISNKIGVPVWDLLPIVGKLEENGLLAIVT